MTPEYHFYARAPFGDDVALERVAGAEVPASGDTHVSSAVVRSAALFSTSASVSSASPSASSSGAGATKSCA